MTYVDSARAAIITVDPAGSQYPQSDFCLYYPPGQPFQFLAGVCASSPGDSIEVSAGTYRETGVLDQASGVISSTGGSAVVGALGNASTTMLRVLTYNTHLFGGECFGMFVLAGATFAEGTRAALIGDAINAEDADLVALQEVWDDDLAAILIDHANYPFVYYDTGTDEFDDCLGTGLLLLSKLPIQAASQDFYNDEDNVDVDCFACVTLGCLIVPNPGCPSCFFPEGAPCSNLDFLDGFASKGYFQATVMKDGFEIGIFGTHTQAGSSDDAVEARANQLAELGGAILFYRALHPNAEVFLAGDLNVSAAGCEYLNSLTLHLIGSHDGYRNAACTCDDGNPCAHTSAADNDLAPYFEPNVGSRLDFVQYTRNNTLGYEVLPLTADIRNYEASPPITEDGFTASDLSDHYGLVVEFKLSEPE